MYPKGLMWKLSGKPRGTRGTYCPCEARPPVRKLALARPPVPPESQAAQSAAYEPQAQAGLPGLPLARFCFFSERRRRLLAWHTGFLVGSERETLKKGKPESAFVFPFFFFFSGGGPVPQKRATQFVMGFRFRKNHRPKNSLLFVGPTFDSKGIGKPLLSQVGSNWANHAWFQWDAKRSLATKRHDVGKYPQSHCVYCKSPRLNIWKESRPIKDAKVAGSLSPNGFVLGRLPSSILQVWLHCDMCVV